MMHGQTNIKNRCNEFSKVYDDMALTILPRPDDCLDLPPHPQNNNGTLFRKKTREKA